MDNRHEWKTPIGQNQMRQFVSQARMRSTDSLNKRRATCKVCGTLVPKGEGVRWYRRYECHTITFFLCPTCNQLAQAVHVTAAGR